MYGSFNEEAQGVWDFVRCQRSNGTFYGTRGKCRNGREVGAAEIPVSKRGTSAQPVPAKGGVAKPTQQNKPLTQQPPPKKKRRTKTEMAAARREEEKVMRELETKSQSPDSPKKRRTKAETAKLRREAQKIIRQREQEKAKATGGDDSSAKVSKKGQAVLAKATPQQLQKLSQDPRVTPAQKKILEGAIQQKTGETPKAQPKQEPKVEPKPKVETPKAQPKQEPKTEAPKAQPKQEPKVETPKAQPKQEPKTEAPKAQPKQEPKVEAPKAQPKQEPKTEKPQTPPQEEPKTKTVTPQQEKYRQVRESVRKWANSLPQEIFEDEAAKEKFIKQKTVEKLNSERATEIRTAQKERLKRTFAPTDGKVKVIALDGKNDERAQKTINDGLDKIRNASPAAKERIDSLMKALENNPAPLMVTSDKGEKPSKALKGLEEVYGGATGGKNMSLNSWPDGGVKPTTNGFAHLTLGYVVMAGAKYKELEAPVTAREARRRLKRDDPEQWTWNTGAASTYLHEMGHVMHGRAFKGMSHAQMVSETERQLAAAGVKPTSRYGKTNPLETVAELYSAYMQNGEELRAVRPQAYKWIDEMAQKAYATEF